MLKRFFFVGFILGMCCGGMAFAATLEPIPDGFNLVVFLNNHANLALGDIITKAPVPQVLKDKVDSALKDTGFNPLRDVTQMQIMGKAAEGKSFPERFPEGVVILTGKFDKDKILAFGKKFAMEEEKISDQTIYKVRQGKTGVLFFAPDKMAVGKVSSVKLFLEARGGKAQSAAFETMKGTMSDKAYATVMFGGDDFLKKKMDKRHAKMKEWAEAHQNDRRVRNPFIKWFHGYMGGGVNPTAVFANLLDDKIEAKLFYDRPEGKGNFIHVLVEISDPKAKIEAMFQDFLKVLPEMRPTAPQGDKSGADKPDEHK